MNKDKVHRIIKRLAEALATLEAEADDEDPWSDEDWDDEDDDADHDPLDELPPRPWTYHGTERVRLDMGAVSNRSSSAAKCGRTPTASGSISSWRRTGSGSTRS